METLDSRIAGLAVGDAIAIPPTGTLKHVQRRVYVLHVGARSRWGTLTEIRADVQRYVQSGYLPWMAAGNHWQ